MWVENVVLKNIRCFDNNELSFKRWDDKTEPSRWITLLGENGTGKSTLLQAMSLLLAGPDGARTLVPRPIGWLKDDTTYGTISLVVHQGQHDKGEYGEERKYTRFSYYYYITGEKTVKIQEREYNNPTIVEASGYNARFLSWLKKNAFNSSGNGWFAAGYGAFRRLTRDNRIIIPSLESPARYTNFYAHFEEDKGITSFERWLVYLDYRRIKDEDSSSVERQYQISIEAINGVLPDGVKFDSVTSSGRIIFDIGGRKVPTIAMSDGFRSALALSGDMIWRLINAFPDSDTPLSEEGVVLIDELDIHLHPLWQRTMPGMLQTVFPNIQFIVATHSPLIAVGAGREALTYRLMNRDGVIKIDDVSQDIINSSADDILTSPAFGLVSTFSPEVEHLLARYSELLENRRLLSVNETKELKQLELDLRGIAPYKVKDELTLKVEDYLRRKVEADDKD